jgi:hypothetical protein
MQRTDAAQRIHRFHSGIFHNVPRRFSTFQTVLLMLTKEKCQDSSLQRQGQEGLCFAMIVHAFLMSYGSEVGDAAASLKLDRRLDSNSIDLYLRRREEDYFIHILAASTCFPCIPLCQSKADVKQECKRSATHSS